MHEVLLADIAFCILGALTMALVARLLRQPPLLGYLAAGLLLGRPIGFGLVADPEIIEAISRLGLVLLLFLIGAEIDLKKLFRAGPAVLGGGLLQVPLNAVALLPACWLCYQSVAGITPGEHDVLYLAIVLALSSTAIIVKLLYEQGDIDTLPGRVTIGIVVIQDLWAIVMLVLQPSLSDPALGVLAKSIGLGFGLVLVVLVIGKYLLPKVFTLVAHSGELTLLMSLAWCSLACAGANVAGLSLEMGALIAGITISTFPVSLEVVTRILSIRDFFVTLFFVTLGLQIPLPSSHVLVVAALLTIAVLISRFVVVVPLIHAFSKDSRTAVVTALNLVPVSEFALVVLALGRKLGHVSGDAVGIATFTMALTAALSPYLIGKSHAIFMALQPLLAAIGLRGRGVGADTESAVPQARFLMLGCYHVGRGFLVEWLRRAPERRQDVHFVDFNPETHARLVEIGVPVTFGDIANLDLLAHLHPDRCEVIICSLPDSVLKGTSSARLLAALRRMAPKAKIVMTAEREHIARDLYRGGADYVLLPHLSGGQELADLLLFDPPLPPGAAKAHQDRVLHIE